MDRFYANSDVVRWMNVDQQSITLHLAKLATELPQAKIDFHLDMLADSYYLHGMSCIAQGSFPEAIEAFRASISTRCKMYERYEMGMGRSLEAGHFQSLLVAFVTKDHPLIARFVAFYRANDGTPDSLFIGSALKLVATNDLEAAKSNLAKKKPRFERQFTGFSECLEAIANKDEKRFVNALNVASENWAKWAAKQAKGLPDSVCFIQGAGLVRLAESVFGRRILIADRHIPPELLR